jgi:fibronectin-binding autotransporter adhesin
MKKILLAPLSFALPFMPSAGWSADIAKLPNNAALNTGTAWSGGAVPTPADVMLWNSTFAAPVNPRTAGSLSTLGGDLSVQGLKVTNVGGTLNTASLAVGYQNAASANTLTLGSGGIDLTTANQALYLESRLTLSADQTWTINNANTSGGAATFNNGEDLAIRGMSGSTTSAPVPFNLGGRTLTTTGNGQSTISSGYNITNGTINVGNNLFLISGGDSRLVTLGSNVTLNVNPGGTLHFQSNSAGVTSAAAINLQGGVLKLVSNNATNLVTLTGTTNVSAASTINAGNNFANGSGANTTGLLFNANLTGSAPLTLLCNNSTATRLQLGGNNSGYAGPVTVSGTAGRIVRLTTANSGSAAAAWTVNAGMILEAGAATLQLGALNGAGTVSNATAAQSTLTIGSGNFSGTLVDGTAPLSLTKSTPGTLTLSGPSSYTGPTLISQGTLALTPDFTAPTPLTIADGATLAINLARAGATTSLPAVTSGTTTGATIQIHTGTTGNPTAAPLSAGSLTISAPTAVQVTGAALTTGTAIPLIGYTTLGGLGMSGLSAVLPPRTTGTLQNNTGASQIELTITTIDKPRWRGNVSSAWDVNDGSGSGTLNWREVTSGSATRFLQENGGTDAALFDDTASSGTVQLTTTLTPGGLAISNSSFDYLFTGTGKLSGSTSLEKTGSATLTIANTGLNDYTGPTIISAGTLRLGDGVTPGAGSPGAGPVTNEGSLVFDRPDNFTVSNVISGGGSLTKNLSGNTTLSGSVTQTDVALNAGTLTFSGGGLISGLLSGSGTLAIGGGTLQLAGPAANPFTGPVSITAGTLQLNQTGGDAITGNISISGTGGLALTQPNQIADTATLTYDKAINGGNITLTNETLAAVTILNGNDTGAQILANNGLIVTGAVTIGGTGVFAIASNHSVNAGSVVLTGTTATLRIAGNTGTSTLNLTGGITASGGTFQVGQGVGAFDAVLNLDGDVTATGNFLFNDGGFTGVNKREINLTQPNHTFNISSGTTTTVNPDIAGTGGLTLTGGGTLQLNSRSASTYTGATLVNAGTLNLLGSLGGTDLTVNAATLAGNGTLLTGTSGLTLNAGAVLAPGNAGPGTLTVDVAGSTLNLTNAVTPAASAALVFELDTPLSSDRVALTGGALSIGSGVLGMDDFSFSPTPNLTAGVYVLFEGDTAITGTLAANTTGTLPGFTTSLAKSADGTDLILTLTGTSGIPTWRQTHFGSTANVGDGANDADPDKDGLPNLVEYLMGTIPVSSASSQAILTGPEAGNLFLQYSRSKTAANDVTAVVEASTDLLSWSSTGVSEQTLSDDGTTQVIKASISNALPARFLRLRVAEK